MGAVVFVGKILIAQLLAKHIANRFGSDPAVDTDSLKRPSFSEGTPIPYVLGTGIRVPGQIIWQSEIREVTDSGKKSGKSGGSSTSYFVDVAIAFAGNECEGAEPLRAISAAGDKVLDLDIDTDVTSDLITQTARTTKISIGASAMCSDLDDEERIEYLHYDSSGEVTDFFRNIRSGFDVVISSAGAPATNVGTFRVLSVELDANGVPGASKMTILRYKHLYGVPFFEQGSPLQPEGCDEIGSGTPGTDDVAGDEISFSQDLPEFNLSTIGAITQYNGSATQDPDPTIELVEGIGNYGAHRGLCYVVLTGFNMTKWGRTLPLFTGVVREGATRTVEEALIKLVSRCGNLTASDVDAAGLDDVVRGFAVVGNNSPADVLRKFMTVHQLGAREVPSIGIEGSFDVKIQFYKLAEPREIEIPDDVLGISPVGEEAKNEGVVLRGVDDSVLINSMTAKFQDSQKEYQDGSRTYNADVSDGRGTAEFSVSHAMTAAEGESLARTEFWNQYLNASEKASLDLPSSYPDVASGDVLIVNDPSGRERRIKLDEVDLGANGIVRTSGYLATKQVYGTSSFAAPSEGTGTGGVTLPPNLLNRAVELPVLIGESGTFVAAHWGVALSSPNASFPGAQGYTSVDNGASWVQTQAFLGTAITGITDSALGDNDILTQYWDNINSVTVTLDSTSATLASSTDQLVLVGQDNWALIGGELIGFVNVTPLGGRTYLLSRLLRGRRNTERFVGLHSSGEQFLLTTGGNFLVSDIGLSSINSTVKFRAVSAGSTVEDSADSEVTLNIEGMGIQPFGPTFLPVQRTAAGDITFFMRFRSRLGFRVLGGIVAPILVAEEAYRITVLDGSAAVRNLDFVGTTVTYTAAQQVDDFGATQSSLSVIGYQFAGTVGLGRYTTETV